jgi:hypothetical protein
MTFLDNAKSFLVWHTPCYLATMSSWRNKRIQLSNMTRTSSFEAHSARLAWVALGRTTDKLEVDKDDDQGWEYALQGRS